MIKQKNTKTSVKKQDDRKQELLMAKTSSLTMDFKPNFLQDFLKSYKVLVYKLPDFIKSTGKYENLYVNIHSWAHSEIDRGYFFLSAKKSIYTICKQDEQAPVYIFDEQEIIADEFKQINQPENIHILLKILLAEYVKKNNHFINSDSFYIFIEMTSKTNNYAKVLDIKLKEDFKKSLKLSGAYPEVKLAETKNQLLVFNFSASVTRLMKVSFADYKNYYAQSNYKAAFNFFKKNEKFLFKRLKNSELTAEKNPHLFVSPKPFKNNKFKTRAEFHSIKSLKNLQKSTSYLLENFTQAFIEYLKSKNIFVQNKNLELEKIPLNTNNKFNLDFTDFKVSLLDLRHKKQKNIADILALLKSSLLESTKKQMIEQMKKQMQQISFVEKQEKDLNSKDNVLLIMDYDKPDFKKYFAEKKDPYGLLKEQGHKLGFVSQGLNLNFHNTNINNETSEKSKELTKEVFFSSENLIYKEAKKSYLNDLSRNFNIALNELILKDAVKRQSYQRLPNSQLLQNKVFYTRNKALFIKDKKLHKAIITTKKDLEKIITEICGLENLEDLIDKIYKYNLPYAKNKSEDISKIFTIDASYIFSTDEVLQIEKYDERVFYDNKELQQRLETRNKERAKTDFLLKNPEKDAKIIAYNQLIEQIPEQNISYEELKGRYKRKNKNEIFKIFNCTNETFWVDLLRKHSRVKDIKGVKQDKLLAMASGVWFAPKVMQYFVGKDLSYNADQATAFQMYKIIVHKGKFNQKDFFDLLNVDFIRNQGTPVLPYPFALLKDSRDSSIGD